MENILVVLALSLLVIMKIISNEIKRNKIKAKEIADKEYCREIYELHKPKEKEEMEIDITKLRQMYEANEFAYIVKEISEQAYLDNLKAIESSISKVERKYGIR